MNNLIGKILGVIGFSITWWIIPAIVILILLTNIF